MRALGLALLCACAPHAAHGEAVFYPAASVQAPVLGLPSSPRSLALGEAGTAMEGDLYSVFGNPVGLARISPDLEFSLEYGSLDPELGLWHESAAIGTLGDVGALALGFNYVSYGALDWTYTDGSYYAATRGFAASGELGWANSFMGERLSLGLSLGVDYEYLGGYWRYRGNGSLGAGWRLGERLNLAAALNRLCFTLGGPEAPSAFSLGVSSENEARSLKLLVDFSAPFHDLPALKAGLEWKPSSYLALRAGYRQRLGSDGADIQSGPTAGFGAGVKRLSLDYAYSSYGSMGSHRIALSSSFPERWIRKPKVVIQAAGGTAAAQAFFDLGTKLLSENRQVEALVAFKQCQQADPEFAGAQERVEFIVGELNQRGGAARDKEVEAMIRRYLDAGLKYFKSGEYKKAISSFEIALEADKKNSEILDHLRQARELLEAAVAKRGEEAAKALDSGDLAGAVRSFYEALKLDPQHAGTKARLSTLKPRILAEIKRLHRLGIDAYVDNKLDEAMALWRQALALDPSDPENVRRDLDKAGKLKQLRS